MNIHSGGLEGIGVRRAPTAAFMVSGATGIQSSTTEQ